MPKPDQQSQDGERCRTRNQRRGGDLDADHEHISSQGKRKRNGGDGYKPAADAVKSIRSFATVDACQQRLRQAIHNLITEMAGDEALDRRHDEPHERHHVRRRDPCGERGRQRYGLRDRECDAFLRFGCRRAQMRRHNHFIE